MSHESFSKRQRFGLNTVRIVVGVVFILFGTLKLIGVPMMVQVFDHVGLGQWFRYATGLIEVGGAVLLLTPRYVGASALMLAATCVGAIVSHLTVVPGSPMPAATLLILTAIVAWAFRARTLALLGLPQTQQVKQ